MKPLIEKMTCNPLPSPPGSVSHRALKSCGPGGTAHVKLVVEWDKETKDL